MYDINIIYIILSLFIDNNTQTYKYYIFYDDNNQLPQIKLNQTENLLESRKKCIYKYTKLNLSWLDDVLIDINDRNNNIDIYYMCRLPIETQMYNGKFTEITTKENICPFIQKAIRFC